MKNCISIEKNIFLVTMLVFFLFCSCQLNPPGYKPKCMPKAYEDDTHKVCNSFELYGNKTWQLDSVFMNGKDITDSVMGLVGGYYKITYGDAVYSRKAEAYICNGNVDVGMGYSSWFYIVTSLDHALFLSGPLQQEPDSPLYGGYNLAPVPYLHNLREPACYVDSIKERWYFQSLTSKRWKFKHKHHDTTYAVIFKAY
jgi:hypothetical protein